jgi:hypothetical protein
MTLPETVISLGKSLRGIVVGSVLDIAGLSAEQAHIRIGKAIRAGEGYAVLKPGFTECALVVRRNLDPLSPRLSGHLFACGVFPFEKQVLSGVKAMLKTNLESGDLLLLPTNFSGLVCMLRYGLSRERVFAKYSYGEPRGTSPLHYDSEHCWWYQLAGKRVAVINPRAKFIVSRHNSDTWSRVWGNAKGFVEFEPVAVEIPDAAELAVREKFKDCSDLLASMRETIHANLNSFDVALVAAGHYGVPICIDLKKCGKVAIQMGGHLQIVFGIYGRRWEAQGEWQRIINENWTKFPLDLRPNGFEQQEGGCYF